MKLLAIDGNSLLNRAFYAIKLLSTKDGQYTNAIFGFLNTLAKISDRVTPDAVAVAFDLKKPTFRHKMYDKYKGTRKCMPPELASQMEPLKAILTELGYTTVSYEGYEADDILGTLGHLSREQGATCYIATGDRDSLQLISNGVHVLLTTTQMGKGETTEMDENSVFEKYGVTPPQLIEVKALMGDSSDNIPGVSGIGEKTALALIQKFVTLDAVYENLDDPAIKPSVRQKLERDRETAYLSRQLAEIYCSVPIDSDLSHYIKGKGNPELATQMLNRLEMHSLIKKLHLDDIVSDFDASAQQTIKVNTPAVELTAFNSSILDASELYLIPNGSEVVASADGIVCSASGSNITKLLECNAIKYCCGSKKLFRAALDTKAQEHGIVFDCELAAYLLSPTSSSYAVENVSSEYGVLPEFKCTAEPGIGYMRPLCNKLKDILKEQKMQRLHDEIELPLARVLAEMEKEGFLIDREGIAQFGSELESEMQRRLAEIWQLAGHEFNVNSTKQLGEVLFVELGLPAGKKTKTGFSTSAEVLEELRYNHPIVDDILQYRAHAKLKSTYVEGLLSAADESGRVHSDFVQTETRTGRISSREPNLQNIPVRTELGSRMRKFFVAAPGHVLIDADYSQIELRVLAGLSGDDKMISAFESGHDIHTETASEIFKVPRKMVTPELRRRAKAVNFGIVYGIGAFSLSKNVGTSIEEAREYISGYLSTYSGVAAYLNRCVESTQEKGYAVTLFGRRRAIPELSSSSKQVQALGRRLAMNTPIQGTAADIIKIAMIRVSERLEAEHLDARLILQVHDELIVESSQADSNRAIAILREEMENAVDVGVSLTVDVGCGQTWYDAK